MTLKIKSVGVISYVRAFGFTEDGLQYTGEVYYVAVELHDGTGYTHGHSFPGCKVWDVVNEDEAFRSFEDVRDEAMTAAEKLADAVRAKGSINLTYWDEIPTGEFWDEDELRHGRGWA